MVKKSSSTRTKEKAHPPPSRRSTRLGNKCTHDEIDSNPKTSKNEVNKNKATKIVEAAMEKYWIPKPSTSNTIASTSASAITVARRSNCRRTTFDEHRKSLLGSEGDNGWRGELRQYLGKVWELDKEIDIIAWWQASSVPCERLFSAGKLIATDRRASLGTNRFEELQLLKSAWKNNIHDIAAWNAKQVEEVDVMIYEALLDEDVVAADWDQELEVL
ncbi:hypothetical protein JOM56_012183 [Amanita muscaria]